jgi:(p)ppGpp synthase/HD superfamily hydrolase
LRDITAVIAEENINISSVKIEERGDTSLMSFILDVGDMAQLNRLLSKVRSVRGVISAIRSSQSRAAINS